MCLRLESSKRLQEKKKYIVPRVLREQRLKIPQGGAGKSSKKKSPGSSAPNPNEKSS